MDGMRAVPTPSGSNLPPFFRWCLGGMSAFASGSGSASARDADTGGSVPEFGEVMNADCGNMPASQEELLARSDFLDFDVEEEGEAELFSTPPLTQQDPQRQGQSQRGQAGDGEEVITMCSMPFTQTPPSPPCPASSPTSSSSSDSWEPRKPRKPRICTRKVRGRAKIRTPTPSPRPSPTPTPSPGPSPELDPLARIVLMIPTAPLQTTGDEDILELARRRGIF